VRSRKGSALTNAKCTSTELNGLPDVKLSLTKPGARVSPVLPARHAHFTLQYCRSKSVPVLTALQKAVWKARGKREREENNKLGNTKDRMTLTGMSKHV
jgi:hypothetical protein